jgi:hypothetical protein
VLIVPGDDDDVVGGSRAVTPRIERRNAALAKTTWGARHQRRVVLMEGSTVLASALRHELVGMLDQRQVSICGISAVSTDAARAGDEAAHRLIERQLDEATRNGADMALLFGPFDHGVGPPPGFDVVPTIDRELKVLESTRHGAPMTMMRGGEDRDLQAIVEMGQVRASPYRFHLNRDVDFVKHAITRHRLSAGLAPTGTRQLLFVIAEEGLTAAAYVVVSVVAGAWTLEECGDRDLGGARVGALLQALIAREPAEARAVIRGWLPPGFLPPQVNVVSQRPAAASVRSRFLGSAAGRPPLSAGDVLYWQSDVF